MITDIFQTVLLMSATGSILALILLAIKPLTKKFCGATWQYYIWLAVLILMILPIRLPLDYNQAAEYNQGQVFIENTATATENVSEKVDINNEATATIATPENTTADSVNLPLSAKEILSTTPWLAWLWLAGFLIALGVRLSRYFIFLRAIRQSSQPCPNADFDTQGLAVRTTSLLDAPIIVGLFRPVLFLPQQEINRQDLRYIISHELVHHRRHDLLYKWFAMAVGCLHWFNPLTYIISKQIDEACEIACDYAVTKDLNQSEKTDYMQTILRLLDTACHKRPLTTQMASGKQTIKRRFTMITNLKKRSKATAFISVLIALLLISTTALAGGMAQNATQDDYQITIYNQDKALTLVHKPFVENNTVYVPLREMLNLEPNVDDSNITYDNGVMQFIVNAEGGTEYRGVTYDNWINRVSTKNSFGYIAGHSEGSTENTAFLRPALLREGTVYVPYDVIAQLADSGQGIFENVRIEAKAKSKNLPPLDGTLYFNDNFDINFSLRLPLEWCNKFIVTEEKNTDNHRVYFYQKSAYEKDHGASGLLFYVQIADGLHHSTNGDFVIHANDKTYSFGYPTAKQMNRNDPSLSNEFEAMSALIDPYIIRSIEVIVSYTPPEDGKPYNMRTGVYNTTNFLDSAEAYIPSDTVDDFFTAFSQGNFDAMKQYCTDDCIKNFFRADSVFGMTKATLSDLSIDELEYAKSSNDFNVFVTVNMTPHKNSAFAPAQTSTSFYIKMLRQPNGYYLIDSFATSL